MNKPHKYKDVIIHWANGGDIQYKDIEPRESHWKDWLVKYNDGLTIPFFYCSECTWRIKPETLRYRVALLRTSGTYWTSTQDEYGDDYEEDEDFIRWLTDWIEVEI